MKKIGSKMRSVALILLSVVIVAALALGLAACGSDGDYDEGYDAGYAAGKAEAGESGGDKTIAGTYHSGIVTFYGDRIITETGYSYGQQVDELILYTDGTYLLASNTVILTDEGESAVSISQTDSVILYGTYTKASTAIDDTYIEVKLSAATRVIWMSTVYGGFYIKNADSDNADDFPTTYVGDDDELISREQFMSDYGAARTFYIVLDQDLNESVRITSTM